MTRFGTLRTLGALALLVGCLGLPLNTFADFVILLGALALLVAGRVRAQPVCWAAAALVTALVLFVRAVLPLPEIQEGHNVFIYDGPGSAFEKALPAEVFQTLRDSFQQRYPNGVQAKAATTAYAFSADALLQAPKYSRVVHSIAFTSASHLRLGAINNWAYNVYWPEHGIVRNALPYFVMYELPAELAGGELCWRGELFWPGADGRYERTVHPDQTCRTLDGPAPVRVYGIDVDPARPLAMALHPPDLIAAATVYAPVVRMLGALLVGLILIRANRHALLLPALSIAGTLAMIPFAAAGLRSGFALDLLHGFIIYQGGNDGLTYSSFAHDILAAAVRGDWWAALRGSSDVFFFMPGQCYFQVAQLALFGETAFGSLLWGCFLPLMLLALMRRLLPERWAVALFVAFLALPLFESFGLWNFYYVRDLIKGFGEPFSYGLFMIALAVILPQLGGARTIRDDRLSWAGVGLALAASVATRPNLAPGAGILLLVTALYLLWHGRGAATAALSAGFAPILLCPLHNWVFGGVFAPFVGATTIGYDLEVSPGDYLRAVVQVVTLDWHTDTLARVGHKLRYWVAPYEVWRQAALAATLWLALRRTTPLALRTLAVMVLAQQVMLLLFLSAGRYGHLTWSLTLLLALVALREDLLPRLARRNPA